MAFRTLIALIIGSALAAVAVLGRGARLLARAEPDFDVQSGVQVPVVRSGGGGSTEDPAAWPGAA
jgi:hypothetical protein